MDESENARLLEEIEQIVRDAGWSDIWLVLVGAGVSLLAAVVLWRLERRATVTDNATRRQNEVADRREDARRADQVQARARNVDALRTTMRATDEAHRFVIVSLREFANQESDELGVSLAENLEPFTNLKLSSYELSNEELREATQRFSAQLAIYFIAELHTESASTEASPRVALSSAEMTSEFVNLMDRLGAEIRANH